MNPNIKIINDDLLAVNFNYVQMGYIKELTLDKIQGDDFIWIIREGKFLVNKDNDPHFEKAISTIEAVMTIPDSLLGTKKGFYSCIRKLKPKWEKKDDKWVEMAVQYYNLEGIEIPYLAVSEWEKLRRKVKAEYIKSNRKFYGIDKIINYLKGKAVKK